MKTNVFVLCVETDMLFESLSDAAKYYNTRTQLFSNMHRGKMKSYKGLHFNFYKDENIDNSNKSVKVTIEGYKFESIRSAANTLGINPATLSYLYRNNKTSYKGMTIKFSI